MPVRVNVQDSSGATKLLVRSTEINSTDAVLTKQGRTHDARFDGDIEVCFTEDAGEVGRSGAHELFESEELGMTGALTYLVSAEEVRIVLAIVMD